MKFFQFLQKKPPLRFKTVKVSQRKQQNFHSISEITQKTWYYIGMLLYEIDDKKYDFCGADPENLDSFGISRDLVYFLQVCFFSKAASKDKQVEIQPILETIDGLASEAWNRCADRIRVLQNFDVPNDWASKNANDYLNGIDDDLQQLQLLNNVVYLVSGRSLASLATEAVQELICER